MNDDGLGGWWRRWQSGRCLGRRWHWVAADAELTGESILALLQKNDEIIEFEKLEEDFRRKLNYSAEVGEFLSGAGTADCGSDTFLCESALDVDWGWDGGRRGLGGCRRLGGGWLSGRWHWITADADLASETVLALLKIENIFC